MSIIPKVWESVGVFRVHNKNLCVNCFYTIFVNSYALIAYHAAQPSSINNTQTLVKEKTFLISHFRASSMLLYLILKLAARTVPNIIPPRTAGIPFESLATDTFLSYLITHHTWFICHGPSPTWHLFSLKSVYSLETTTFRRNGRNHSPLSPYASVPNTHGITNQKKSLVTLHLDCQEELYCHADSQHLSTFTRQLNQRRKMYLQNARDIIKIIVNWTAQDH